jgi:hypothetical protein
MRVEPTLAGIDALIASLKALRRKVAAAERKAKRRRDIVPAS